MLNFGEDVEEDEGTLVCEEMKWRDLMYIIVESEVKMY